MKHSIKQFLLTVLVALVSIPASAYDFKVDGMYYDVVSVSGLTCEVASGYSKYSGDVKIPSTVTYSGRTFSVIGIDGYAFQNCSDLTSVDIPNSVKSIDYAAFYGCSSLTSLVIPNSVTSIDKLAFSRCTSLTSVDIPNSVTNLGESAFSGCTSLTSVVIPNSLTYIFKGTFSSCSSLTSVKVGTSVYVIYDNAFSGCTSLTSIVIPNSVQFFYQNAFSGCTSLTSVKIGNNVVTIYPNAFSNCSSLTKVEVGNAYGLGVMLDYAKTLIIAEDYNGTSLPSETYSSYTGLDTIVCRTVTPPTLPATFSDSQYETLVVIVPTEALATYQATDVWKDFWCLQGGAESYTTTGIATATIDRSNKASTIYDLNGRKLPVPQRGLNIINGKKVLVK